MTDRATDTTPTFKNEVRAFFSAYLSAFHRQDAVAISELWDEVGLFPSPTGNFSMDRDAFRSHCVTLLDFYRKQGVAEPTGELLSAEEVFPSVAQARMAQMARLSPTGSTSTSCARRTASGAFR